ncbi:hypothetical protein RXV95_07885 [Novosphingobium sp. ZN18A2]|uniref:hypothetical protein n=1 Tax=Novosphingobium sp. ZN18A2 TaxID=3079861 RepID=UPI0030CEC61C
MACTALLVVADDALRNSIAFLLEAEGFVVLADAGGDAALPQADCIVIDHCGQLHNLERNIARVRAMSPGLPVLIVASNPSSKLRRIVADANAHLVEKPLLTDSLIAKLRRLADGAASHGG